MELDVRKEAARQYNEAWDLLDIPAQERTAEQNAELLHKAHTSRFLWGLVGEPKNFARGEWQVSRAYASLGFGEPALLHGKLSLDIAEKHNLGGMDLPFGHEAVARAYAILGDKEKALEHKNKGLESIVLIEKEEDRRYAEGELNGIL
jgi:hypothetical protein